MNWLARLRALCPDMRDVFVRGGVALIGYGAGMVHPAAGFIVAGAALLWLGARC